MASSVTLGIGVLLTVMAVLAFGLNFSTDYWALWTVDRNALKKYSVSNPGSDVAKNINSQGIYFTRYYGLWRTCYPGNESYQFLSTVDGVTDNYCLLVNYELGEVAPTYSASPDYWTMINLRRCTFAFMVSALASGLFTCIAGTWGCWKATHVPNCAAGVLAIFAALFGGAALACFHGVHYIEQNVLTGTGFYSTWPTPLKNASLWNLQWSYIVGWVGVALTLLTGVLFLVESYNIKAEKKRLQKRPSSKRFHDYYSDIDRRSISGHVSNPMVPPPAQMQPPRSIDRQMSQKSQGPLGNGVGGHPDDDDRLVPVLVYDNFGQEGDLQYLQTSNFQNYT